MEYNLYTMKKQITILLTLIVLMTGMPVQSEASSLLSRVWDKVDSAFTTVKQKTSDVFSNVKETTSDFASEVKEKASNAKNKVVSTAIAAKEKTVETASNIGEAISDKASEIKERVSNTASNIKETVSDKASRAKDKVVSATSEIKANISAKTTSVKNKVSEIASNVKEAVTGKASDAKRSVATAASAVSEGASETKGKVSSFFSNALDKARSTLQGAFNMNFLSSVPVIFWKDHFNTMFEHAQNSVDNINLEHNGELITREDFQDDKALHIKKSAELALHIKSLTGCTFLAYGATLAVGGIKELIDGSFLNPNGGRCWEDFYADIVGASAVFGEKSFDKKLNKYMDSFLKENRTVDQVPENATSESAVTLTETVNIEKSVAVPEEQQEITGEADVSEADTLLDIATERQRLTEEYYKAVQKNDAAAVREISAKLKALK